jgi:hypothetical protein
LLLLLWLEEKKNKRRNSFFLFFIFWTERLASCYCLIFSFMKIICWQPVGGTGRRLCAVVESVPLFIARGCSERRAPEFGVSRRATRARDKSFRLLLFFFFSFLPPLIVQLPTEMELSLLLLLLLLNGLSREARTYILDCAESCHRARAPFLRLLFSLSSFLKSRLHHHPGYDVYCLLLLLLLLLLLASLYFFFLSFYSPERCNNNNNINMRAFFGSQRQESNRFPFAPGPWPFVWAG